MNYCDKELITGDGVVYCLLEEEHGFECVFADPKVVYLLRGD